MCARNLNSGSHDYVASIFPDPFNSLQSVLLCDFSATGMGSRHWQDGLRGKDPLPPTLNQNQLLQVIYLSFILSQLFGIPFAGIFFPSKQPIIT